MPVPGERTTNSSSSRIELNGRIAVPDWHLIGLNQAVELIEEWKKYQFQFQA
jgi:hypothetical protein